ncbi:MAG: SRPBCC family protein [Ardenticatenaceae bacterium]|nr:SRPBCC family protein [Ardenticatenaceae bacterium]
MPTITTTVIINSSVEKVWSVLADFPSVMNYNPSIIKSFGHTDKPNTGSGAERTCEFDPHGKRTALERITRFEDGSSYDFEIYGGTQTPPVDNFKGTVQVHRLGENRTKVESIINYDLKRDPINWLIGQTVVRRIMKNVAGKGLFGLKAHIETGTMIADANVLKQTLASIR